MDNMEPERPNWSRAAYLSGGEFIGYIDCHECGKVSEHEFVCEHCGAHHAENPALVLDPS